MIRRPIPFPGRQRPNERTNLFKVDQPFNCVDNIKSAQKNRFPQNLSQNRLASRKDSLKSTHQKGHKLIAHEAGLGIFLFSFYGYFKFEFEFWETHARFVADKSSSDAFTTFGFK